MTVLEQLAQIVSTLGPEAQRQVLDVAIRLRDGRALPDISLPAAGADEAAWAEWRDRVRVRSTQVLAGERQRLQGLGLVDEHWDVLTDEIPADMLPASKTGVET
jgi:hypothetical protein